MRRTLSIGYDAAAVPAGGCAVLSSPAAPTPREFEPAGAIFHEVAMKQAGVYGEWWSVVWCGAGEGGTFF